MLKHSGKSFRGAVLALVLALLPAVSSWADIPAGLSQAQVSELEQRARERWQALSAGDYGKVWEYSTPVYRSIFPKELYVLQFSYVVERELTGLEVLNYDAPAAVASVAVRVMSKPTKHTSAASQAVGAVPITITEQWILIDGKWWHSANV
jgi:hypothetical protein